MSCAEFELLDPEAGEPIFAGSQQELKSSTAQAFYQLHPRPSNVVHSLPQPQQLGFEALRISTSKYV